MRIIGLDIGGFSIKAVEIEVGLRHLEVVSLHEKKLPLTAEPPKPEQIKEAIRELFIQDHLLPPFKLITTVPSPFVSPHTVAFPFKDKAKISQALPSELEIQIPFALEDIVFDYHISVIENRNAKVLTLVTPKDVVKERLDLFEGLDFTPDIVTTLPAALFNLTVLDWEKPEGVYAIADMGHHETALCLIEGEEIRHIRTIGCAGSAITEAIQKNYNLSLEEAEKGKIENGFIITSDTQASPDQIKFSDCVKQAIDPLILQMNQTFHAIRSKGEGIVRKIFLTGGSSRLQNLGQYISEELGVEAEILKPLNTVEINTLAVTDENNAKCAGPLALALGGIGRRQIKQFNFRKDEFSAAPSGRIAKEMRYPLRLGMALALIVVMGSAADYFILKSTARHIERQMTSITHKFPVKIPDHLLSSAQGLRSYLGKKSREQTEKMKALGGQKTEILTALQTLKEVSTIVPKGNLFDVREFTLVDRRIKIKAIADSFNAIDNIEKSFKNNKNFMKISKGEISTASDGVNKNFTLSLEIKKKKNR